jgi:hypothetical protein
MSPALVFFFVFFARAAAARSPSHPSPPRFPLLIGGKLGAFSEIGIEAIAEQKYRVSVKT